MPDGPPTDRLADDDDRHFGLVPDVDVTVHGDVTRTHLARRVIENREAISAKAVHLLESFMRDHGAFDLTSIEVFVATTPEEGDFALSFSFIAISDLHKYNYTYFDVFFFSRPASLTGGAEGVVG